ncbi:exosortase-associated protein EpsI, V-type [Bradyrhizobium sp. CCGUVB14]|uniref:exosortase-associated protein EpsI, V-type n=1 Tax=Bradyrhizobium sp. CCGUVB14 TaxID=2949628 RepID=UPI0020B44B36|nr:exosortase-associated protein EpsI, V-type [Bradyrhizobium sp. CCGUVB14]MCP3442057.1 EpsI family protein [Bradyrhizobium sp. CCGUVB14]
MKSSRIGVVLASIAIAGTAIAGEVFAPRQLMARTTASQSLETVIPKQFGNWKLVPEISPVKPVDPEAYVQPPDPLLAKVYSQEVARGYTDGEGHIVMLLVAYGPVQNYKLKAHRPEICYTANGFRVSEKNASTLAVSDGALKITRLIAERESRYEPITYWMKVGNEISNGVVDNQISRLKYGLRGIIPDGSLIRVSTIGLNKEASFKLQDQFIRELLAALPSQEREFFLDKS